MKRVLTFMLVLVSVGICSAQDMYKALKKEHNQRRFGLGVQALEPTGLNVQMFRGYFCSGDDTYATRGVWELGVGVENTVLSKNDVEYKDGFWKKGGIRAELNYLYPVFTLETAVVLQTYIGAGIQTGSRQYVNLAGEQSTIATGGNLFIRLEGAGQGFEAGDGILFLSVYVDAKFHKDFSEDFQYFKPSVGIRIRKAR